MRRSRNGWKVNRETREILRYEISDKMILIVKVTFKKGKREVNSIHLYDFVTMLYYKIVRNPLCCAFLSIIPSTDVEKYSEDIASMIRMNYKEVLHVVNVFSSIERPAKWSLVSPEIKAWEGTISLLTLARQRVIGLYNTKDNNALKIYRSTTLDLVKALFTNPNLTEHKRMQLQTELSARGMTKYTVGIMRNVLESTPTVS